MKKAILIATFSALTLGSHAGDWGKAPVGKAPIQECADLGGSLAAGYETDFIFKGVRLAGDSVWSNINYTYDGLALPITLGAFYLNGINDDITGLGDFDVLRVSADVALGSFAGFDVSAGYAHYVFPEFHSKGGTPLKGFGELGLNLSRNLGYVDLTFSANYLMGGNGTSLNGWYYEAGLAKAIELTDNVNLVLGAGLAYSDGVFFPFVPNANTPRDSGWSHYYLKAALPITLNCRTTLTPYIGYTGAPDTWVAHSIGATATPQSDILHGGVSLSVSF